MIQDFQSRLSERFMRELRKLARNRRSGLAQYLNGLAVEFHRNFENWNYKLSSNGEARVLEVLSKDAAMKMVFDVGANHGSWSLLAASKFPKAAVHAFELSPVVAASFRGKAAAEPRVVTNSCGLSDCNEEIEFFYAPGRDLLSSGVAITGTVEMEKARGQVRRGADDCRENGITQIDFLKIDVEGMEDRVLRSFTIGKIYPQEVIFKDYYYDDENFLGPNYLAVLSTETELRQQLAGPPL